MGYTADDGQGESLAQHLSDRNIDPQAYADAGIRHFECALIDYETTFAAYVSKLDKQLDDVASWAAGVPDLQTKLDFVVEASPREAI